MAQNGNAQFAKQREVNMWQRGRHECNLIGIWIGSMIVFACHQFYCIKT